MESWQAVSEGQRKVKRHKFALMLHSKEDRDIKKRCYSTATTIQHPTNPFTPNLSKLPPDNPQRKQRRMSISEEPSRILLDLRDLEAGSRIGTRRRGQLDARGKRPGQAADTDAALVIADRVGECESWRAGGAAEPFVDVSGGFGGGGVVADYVQQCNILGELGLGHTLEWRGE